MKRYLALFLSLPLLSVLSQYNEASHFFLGTNKFLKIPAADCMEPLLVMDAAERFPTETPMAAISDKNGNLLMTCETNDNSSTAYIVRNSSGIMIDGQQGKLKAGGHFASFLPFWHEGFHYLLYKSVAGPWGSGTYTLNIAKIIKDNSASGYTMEDVSSFPAELGFGTVAMTEKADGTGYLLVVSGKTRDTYLTIELTADGFGKHTESAFPASGEVYDIKISPRGDMVVFSNTYKGPEKGINNCLEVYDFDNKSGALSHRYTLTPLWSDTQARGIIELSPDGSKIYISEGHWRHSLIQFDLSLANPAAISKNFSVLWREYLDMVPVDHFFTSLEAGPDGKIYFTYDYGMLVEPEKYKLGVIHCPNQPGDKANIETDLFGLEYKGVYHPLKGFVSNWLDLEKSKSLDIPMDTVHACEGSSVEVQGIRKGICLQPEWQKDGKTVIANDLLKIEELTPDRSGMYYFRSEECSYTFMDSVYIRIQEGEPPVIYSGDLRCEDNSLLLFCSEGYDSLLWTVDTGINTPATYNNVDSIRVSLPCTVSLYAESGECKGQTEVSFEKHEQAPQILSQSSICQNDSIFVYSDNYYESLTWTIDTGAGAPIVFTDVDSLWIYPPCLVSLYGENDVCFGTSEIQFQKNKQPLSVAITYETFHSACYGNDILSEICLEFFYDYNYLINRVFFTSGTSFQIKNNPEGKVIGLSDPQVCFDYFFKANQPGRHVDTLIIEFEAHGDCLLTEKLIFDITVSDPGLSFHMPDTTAEIGDTRYRFPIMYDINCSSMLLPEDDTLSFELSNILFYPDSVDFGQMINKRISGGLITFQVPLPAGTEFSMDKGLLGHILGKIVLSEDDSAGVTLGLGNSLAEITANIDQGSITVPEICVRNLRMIEPYFPLMLEVSPNPATDITRVTVVGTYTGDVEWRVIQTAGGTAKKGTFNKTANVDNFDIDLRDLGSGTYTLRAVAGSRTAKRSFVIQK